MATLKMKVLQITIMKETYEGLNGAQSTHKQII